MCLKHELVYLPVLGHDFSLRLRQEVKPAVYDSVDLLYYQCGSVGFR